MGKNHSVQAIWLTLLVLCMLIGLSFLPPGLSLYGFDLKQMDIFSDVRDSVPEAPEAPADASPSLVDTFTYDPADTLVLVDSQSLATNTEAQTPPPLPPKDSLLFGRALEDYTFSQHGMHHFFAAVDSIRKGRKVRIAWYGDSFVEGDILIGDLRDTLQTLWGGAGVGFVPITSEVAQFKRTLKHSFKGWTAYSIVKKSENRPPLGLNGYAYRPGSDARVHYEGARYFRNTRQWGQFRLFYTANGNFSFNWQLNDGQRHEERLSGAPGKLGEWLWQGGYTDAISLSFPASDNLMLYGATIESGPGVYLDNFSVRGNSGGPLKLIAPDFVRQFDAIQQYDLIVLQVGLNAVTNSLNNIRWYEAELDRTIKHLKSCFPGKPILLVSVGDRDGKNGDVLTTMKGVPAIVQMQRTLARKHGLLFYDLFWGMGGPETMLRFAHQRPRLANTDYTHLTHEGGKVVGHLFANLFLQEQEKWKHKKLQ